MQHTLLGLAVAAIVALLAALLAPLAIDWASHHELFEAEASRLIGAQVRIAGAIDARLLPSPRLILRDVEIGSGDDKLKARAVAVEFALGPLLRRQWRMSELVVTGGEMRAGLDAAGRLAGPHWAPVLDPDAVSVDRLTVEDSRLALGDAENGAGLVLDKLWFNGELRSLAGPLRGEGAATVGGELYPFRITLSHSGPEGALSLHLNVDPTHTPLNVESDGIVALGGGAPLYDGTLNVRRPLAVARERDALVTQPWRLGGKIKVTAASAVMETAEFQYGPEEGGIKLTGAAEVNFGREPRFNGVVSTRAVDLDRLAGDTARAPPAATLRRLAGLATGVFRPPIPVTLGIGIDQVTLGGATMQAVRGDMTSTPQGWSLERFEFRAPGASQIRLSGELAVGTSGVNFSGPVDVTAADAGALAAWLEGRTEAPSAAARAVHLRGDLALGTDRIAIDRLEAVVDRNAIAGRFSYVFAKDGMGASLDAALSAPELDVDQASAFFNAALAGSVLERPHEAVIAIDIARVRIAGIDARNASARLRLDAGRLEIARLALDDFGGVGFSANGDIGLSGAPRGGVTIEFNARDLTAAVSLADRFSPAAAQALRRAAPLVVPAKLRAKINLEGSSPLNRAMLSVEGTGGALRLDLKGQASVDLGAFDAATIRLQGKVDAADGSALLVLLGLERAVAAGKEPGTIMLSASGPLFGELQTVARINAGGLAASLTGSLRAANGPSGSGYANVERADVAPLFAGRFATLPVAMTARLGLSPSELAVSDLSAVVGGSRIRGKIAVGLDRPWRLGGELNADTLDLGALVPIAAGLPNGSLRDTQGRWTWTAEPIRAGIAAAFEGGVALKSARAAIAGYELRDLTTTLRFKDGGASLDDLAALFAGGALRGKASLTQSSNGLDLHLDLAIKDADAEAFWPQAARAPVSGKLDIQAAVAGSGRSPVALVGALQGTGKIALRSGQLAGLDPRAFDTVMQAIDKGMAIDPARISTLVGNALDSGQLAVKKAAADITIDAGRLRLAGGVIEGDAADGTMSGGVDLTDGTMDLRMVLSGAANGTATRPDIFLSLRGSLAAPVRRIDVSALTGWLTMRAVERQSRRLEQVEPPKAPRKTAPAAPAPLQLQPQN